MSVVVEALDLDMSRLGNCTLRSWHVAEETPFTRNRTNSTNKDPIAWHIGGV